MHILDLLAFRALCFTVTGIPYLSMDAPTCSEPGSINSIDFDEEVDTEEGTDTEEQRDDCNILNVKM